MDLPAIGLLLAGFAILVGGGELLVRGASALAAALGMSPLVVGLTVVAFATSAPELAVTVQAVSNGNPDLAIGNVVGSNIANVLLVLGISAVLSALVVRSQMVRVDVPVMVALSVLLLLLALDGTISRSDAVVLLACLVGYVTSAILMGRREGDRDDAGRSDTAAHDTAGHDTAGYDTAGYDTARDPGPPPGAPGAPATGAGAAPARITLNVVLLIMGVALLVLGAELLVSGATRIASALGMPQMVIGLTIVAVGTSLPELATSIIASVRGQRDLAVGNAVGSNIFNIGGVLGISGLVARGGIPVSDAAINFDLPVMVGVSVCLLPIVYTGFAIARWEGLLFLGLYAAYTAYLLLNATDHEKLPAFSAVMVGFVLPMVAVSIGVTVGFDVGRKRGREEALAQVATAPTQRA